MNYMIGVRTEENMDIKIKATNTNMSDKSKVMEGITVGGIDNISVEMDNVEIKDEAKFLNNLTDRQVDSVLERLEEQMELLEKNREEYEEIKNLLADIRQGKSPAREILKQHLPNLLTGTLANVLSGIVMGIKS